MLVLMVVQLVLLVVFFSWCYGAAGCPGPDPCNSCTVTNAMADMMIPACMGRKKKRAILESALFEGFNISPSPSSQADIER